MDRPSLLESASAAPLGARRLWHLFVQMTQKLATRNENPTAARGYKLRHLGRRAPKSAGDAARGAGPPSLLEGKGHAALRGLKRRHLRCRSEPSCATEATRVPSCLKIMPRVSPRPPRALGESWA